MSQQNDMQQLQTKPKTKRSNPIAQRNRHLAALEQRLDQTMAADQDNLSRQLERLKKLARQRHVNPHDWRRFYGRVEKQLEFSERRWTQRRQNRPIPKMNPELPIAAKQDEIVAAIQSHPAIVVSGETGSGKTTQLPKYCLAAGRGICGMIGCSQPRRIAAITVARRIAEEFGESLGQSVGYKIRFQDRTDAAGYIKLMTDGILLAEAQGDPRLNAYDTLIVDEAHERSLNIDFVLGFLRRLQTVRNNLKIIISSATIDTAKFSAAFDHAPIIEVSGRMYPVELRYWPPAQDDDVSDLPDYVDMAVSAVERVHAESVRGDVLVFMPTEQDIRLTCDRIDGRGLKGAVVLPLYGRLSANQQQRVFARPVGRKIVVATNVAETSITIPGIRYVIDTGLARISRYMPGSRTTALPIVPISKSSADQRMGRCGRVEDGICIRLYPPESYDERPAFTPPEISRANLAEVILRMVALKLGDLADFPFIDPPPIKSVQDGYRLLRELDAIAELDGQTADAGRFGLTATGRVMARLPLDPRLSAMLIEATRLGCLDELMVIAAVLSIQDPRERPADKQVQADAAHRTFNDPDSDFITLYNIWKAWQRLTENGGGAGQLKRFCHEHFISFRRMWEWRDVYQQLRQILSEAGLMRKGRAKTGAKPVTPRPNDTFTDGYTAIHQCILSGFLSNIAQKKEQMIFKAARGREAMVFPGSVLFKNAPDWIVAAEMVTTSRLFARTAAKISVDWIEPLAGTRCRRTYLHAHWEQKREAVVALEQVSLYGLILHAERKVAYGPLAPETARTIFIQSALIEGQMARLPAFLAHNLDLIQQVREREDRLRRRDLLIDDSRLFQLYDARLGMVYDRATLQRWLKQADNEAALHFKLEMLMNYDPNQAQLAQYPSQIATGQGQFECRYCFEPGSDEDGVTIDVPTAAAPTVNQADLDWLVPGLLVEKITMLLKGLPKSLRRQLAPVSQTARLIAEKLPMRKINFEMALSQCLQRHFNIDVAPSTWREIQLPDHLKMRIELTAPDGQVVRSGRDASILADVADAVHEPRSIRICRQKWEKTNVIAWDFGELPETVCLGSEDDWVFYPALQIDADTGRIDLRLLADSNQADKLHRQGVAALLKRKLAPQLKFARRLLKMPPVLKASAAGFGGLAALEKRLFERLCDELLSQNVRTADQFETLAARAAESISPTIRQLVLITENTLRAWKSAFDAIADLQDAGGALQVLGRSLAGDLVQLAPENFLTLYDLPRLNHLDRYLNALALRAQRALLDIGKDRPKQLQVEPFQGFLKEQIDQMQTGASSMSHAKHAAIEDYFWLLEEYKVSVFAQELKTAVPVSAKRLKQAQREIVAMV